LLSETNTLRVHRGGVTRRDVSGETRPCCNCGRRCSVTLKATVTLHKTSMSPRKLPQESVSTRIKNTYVAHGPLKSNTQLRPVEYLWLKKSSELSYHDSALIVGDATDIPLRNRSVDYVVCNSLLEHIPPQRRTQFARETVRVTRRGYFISTPNYWFPLEPHYNMPFFQLLSERLKRRLRQRVPIGYVFHKDAEVVGFLVTKSEPRRLFPRAAIGDLYFTLLLAETLVAWQQLIPIEGYGRFHRMHADSS